MVIVGVLVGIAYPTYLGYKERANQATAEANLRQAIPAIEAFYNEFQTYDTAVMTMSAIKSFDQGLSPDFAIVSGTPTSYCVSATHGGSTYYKDGPGAQIGTAPCT